VRVYVAGPMGAGVRLDNCMNAIREGMKLMEAGHAPSIPHASFVAHMMVPQSYERWMEWDFQWIEVCDAMVRLPGDSPGSDREVEPAKTLGIPVFAGVEAFLAEHPAP